MTDQPAIPTFGPSGGIGPGRPPYEPGSVPDRTHLRIGDSDRLLLIDELTKHCAEGRLTIDELEQRRSQAWSSRTQHDLNRLVEDLPPPKPDRKPEPSFKAWLADGRALLQTLPPRLLVGAAASAFVVLMLLLARCFHEVGL